jgi:hypothetical protein
MTQSFFIILYVFLSSISYSLQALRLLGIADNRIFFYIELLYFLILAPLFLYLNKRKLSSDSVSMLMLWLFVIASFTGVLFGMDIYQYIWQIILLLYCFLGLLIGKELHLSNAYKIFKWVALVILLSGFIGIFSSVIIKFLHLSQHGLYHSFGGPLLLFPLVWYFEVNKKKLFLLTLVLIVFAGKVGVILAAFSFILFRLSYDKFIKVVLFFGGVFIIVGFLTPDLSNSVIGKVNSYNIFKDTQSDFILENYGGSRGKEILAVSNELKKSPIFSMILGHGFGHKYYVTEYDSSENKVIYNAHFTPITMLSKFGIIGLWFYCYLIYLSIRGMKSLSVIVRTASWFLFCSMIFSLTAYNIFTNAFLWICVGLIISNNFKRGKFSEKYITYRIRENGNNLAPKASIPRTIE